MFCEARAEARSLHTRVKRDGTDPIAQRRHDRTVGAAAKAGEGQLGLYWTYILRMVYTSPSHTEDTPRWRVIGPPAAELTPELREKLMGRLNGRFGGMRSVKSWTLSQAYYFGSVRDNASPEVHVIDRTPTDEHDDLTKYRRADLAPPPKPPQRANV